MPGREPHGHERLERLLGHHDEVAVIVCAGQRIGPRGEGGILASGYGDEVLLDP